ncbi:nucleotidyltransferase family protein [Neptuniibacter halophilus]|uniref:nucleotidyltransferase family protein n=1 Tax=Neptuniibacter halophilus TaxID=651666 RepID=UPI00257253B8|nr:nucleotidyltransferase family protein [Neptuniibacter halophilus]
MSLAVLIMAAGSSSRFGGCKLLAEVAPGVALLEHSIQLAMPLQAEFMAIVSGAWHAEIVAAQQQQRVTALPLIHNPNWQEGLGSSIAEAVRQLPEDTDQLLILLADQIALTTTDLQRLLLISDPADVVCAEYAGRRGVPALFRRALFPELISLQGDKGAKQLLYSPSLHIETLAMPNAEQDIDTPEALAHYLR